MPPAKGPIAFTLALLLTLTLLLAPGLPAQEEQPPLKVVDVTVHPEHGSITNQTENVTFNATIQNNDYEGEATVTFNLSGTTIAEVTQDWGEFPFAEDELQADSRDDDLGGDGEWNPTAGDHVLNVTVYDEDDEPVDWTEHPLPLGPDLTLQDPTATPSEPVEGEAVDIEATITNEGTWATPYDETINITLLSPQGEEVDKATIKDLEPDTTADVTLQWVAQADTNTLTIRIEDEIEESRTDNNQATLEITGEPADPRLIVSDIQVLPSPAPPGEETAVQATLTNTGNAATPETTTNLTFGDEAHPQTTDPVDAGEPRQVLWEITPEIGLHTLTVTVDEDHHVTPPDDPDRSMTYNLTVGPDLAITSIRPSPEEPTSGDTVRVEATVENQGSAIENRINVALFQDDQLVDDVLIDALAEGGSTTVTLGNWTATSGDHTFHIEADPDENINEASTDNNRATLPLTIDPQPPVIELGTPGLTQLDVDPGDPLAFEVTVTNDGDLAAEDLTVRFTLNDAPLSDVLVDSLDPDESRTITSHEWTANQGAHTLTVLVGSTDELDDDNPRARSTLPFAIGPNLAATSLDLSPSEPRLGDTILVNTTIENQGTQATGAFQVTLNVDGRAVDEASLDDMPPRSTATIAHTWHVEGAAEELTITLDARGEVDEVDESNNELTRNVTVETNVPHLLAEDLTSDPRNPIPGDNVTFSLRIVNQGAPAGSFDVTFFVENETLSTHTVRTLDQEGEETVTSDPWEATEGTANITAVIDPEHHIPQPTREDNEAELTLSVDQPHLLPGPGIALLVSLVAAAVAAKRR